MKTKLVKIGRNFLKLTKYLNGAPIQTDLGVEFRFKNFGYPMEIATDIFQVEWKSRKLAILRPNKSFSEKSQNNFPKINWLGNEFIIQIPNQTITKTHEPATIIDVRPIPDNLSISEQITLVSFGQARPEIIEKTFGLPKPPVVPWCVIEIAKSQYDEYIRCVREYMARLLLERK